MRNLKDIKHKVTLKSACGIKTQVEYIQTKKRYITAQHTADQHSIFKVILKKIEQS